MKKYLLIIVIGLFFWTNYLNAQINTIDDHHNPFGYLEKNYPECQSDNKEQTV